MSRINVITNIDNGKGLQRDYYLLRRYLQERGHRVIGLQYDRHSHLQFAPSADLNIFCETLMPGFYPLAERNVVFVNPEWWLKDYQNAADGVDEIWCKTQAGMEAMKHTGKARLIGFIAEDRLDKSIPRVPRFLHIAGGSKVKNTVTVLDAWNDLAIPAELVVIGHHFAAGQSIPGVEWHRFISLPEVIRFQNSCHIHLCCSGCEGYGHYIHEGMSTGNVLLVTDYPPMNEVNTASYLKIPTDVLTPIRATHHAAVKPESIFEVCMKALNMNDNAKALCGSKLRKQFERQQVEFDVRMTEAVG